MKKFLRIALVFALAGATLVGCTKDYSGDISDLNKQVSGIQSTVSALQSDLAGAKATAESALTNAQSALKAAQDAAAAAQAANNDAEVAALADKVAALEANVADLEKKVAELNGLEAKLNDVADQLKKDVDAKVDAALEEIQKELEKAIAQVEGNFSVEALGGTATYASAKWAPETSKLGQARLAKLAKVFPELAELKKGDIVETFGHLNFIVNPSSVALDETYKFYLIGDDGKDSGVVLGNPKAGAKGEITAQKAGLNVWNVEVQKPAYKDGKATGVDNKALVVENAAGVYAHTTFGYGVNVSTNDETFEISGRNKKNPFKYDDTKSENSFNAFDSLFTKHQNLYEDYFIIEADPADVEEFGIEIDGSKIALTEAPENEKDSISFTITAVSVAGKTATATQKLYIAYKKSVAPNAELKDQTITLGVKNGNYNVPVKYNVADFEFSALEWKTVYAELKKVTSVKGTYKNAAGQDTDVNFGSVVFFKENGDAYTTAPAVDKYSTVAAFGFNVNSQNAIPTTYTVKIDAGEVFFGKGELTVQNPEAKPIKLAEALCDADGVLQIVGSSNGSYIEYDLKQAFITSNGTTLVNKSFFDEDKVYDEDPSWVKDSTTFYIPVQGGKWSNNGAIQKLLYAPHNFSVKFTWFGNSNNTGKFEFKAEAVSPIYTEDGANFTLSEDFVSTIYFVDDQATEDYENETSLIDAVAGGKYVAGDKKGTAFEITSITDNKGAEWIKAKKEDIANLSTVQFVTFTSPDSTLGANSNVNDSTSYVKGTDGLPVSVALKDAYDMEFLTLNEYMTYSVKTNPSWTYYLTKENWEAIEKEYTDIVAYGYNYSGGLIGKNDTGKTEKSQLDQSVKNVKTSINALAEAKKAQFNYFSQVINRIYFSAKTFSFTYYAGQVATLAPKELKQAPYFTCANKDNYTNYVTFGTDDKGHITSITANPTYAGQQTVEIPLTANVEDKWGMTTKFTVKVTVKVNE